MIAAVLDAAVGVRMRVDEEGELLARSNHVFESLPKGTVPGSDDV